MYFDWLDWYKGKHRWSQNQMPSKDECMEFLKGQYPHAFELVAEHDDMVSQGAKSIRDRGDG